MPAQKIGLTIPLPLQFLAAWLAVWLGRVLQEQVNFVKAENRLLREKLGEVTASTGEVVRRDRLGGLLGFYYREAA